MLCTSSKQKVTSRAIITELGPVLTWIVIAGRVGASIAAELGTIKVTESYQIDKQFECKNVFGTDDTEHPGVKMVMGQKDWNIAGPVKVLSESYFPEQFKGIYQRPAKSRKIFEEKGMIRLQLMDMNKGTMLFDFKVEKIDYPILKKHMIEHLNKFDVLLQDLVR